MRGPALGRIHAIASIFPRQSILAPFPQSQSKLSLKSPPTKNSKSSLPTRRHQLRIPARHLGEVWEGRRRPLGISGRWNDGSVRGGGCKRGISVRVAGRKSETPVSSAWEISRARHSPVTLLQQRDQIGVRKLPKFC